MGKEVTEVREVEADGAAIIEGEENMVIVIETTENDEIEELLLEMIAEDGEVEEEVIGIIEVNLH